MHTETTQVVRRALRRDKKDETEEERKAREKRKARLEEARAARRALRPAVINPHQIYERDESLAILSVSRSKLYHLIAAGKIEPIKKIDSRLRFSGAELIRFTASA